MNQPDNYWLDRDYNETIKTLMRVPQLLNVKPCPITGQITPDGIKLELGLRCNIWPASILPLRDPEDRSDEEDLLVSKKSKKQ